jgi:hypothetical protein
MFHDEDGACINILCVCVCVCVVCPLLSCSLWLNNFGNIKWNWKIRLSVIIVTRQVQMEIVNCPIDLCAMLTLPVGWTVVWDESSSWIVEEVRWQVHKIDWTYFIDVILLCFCA